MANKIGLIIIGLLLSFPLLISILYLLKILLIENDRSEMTFPLYLAKKILCLFGIAIAIFLLVFIIQRYIYEFMNLSGFWNVFGIVLFVLYFFGLFGLIFGLGQSGHGGVSPKDIILELYTTVFSKKNRKN